MSVLKLELVDKRGQVGDLSSEAALESLRLQLCQEGEGQYSDSLGWLDPSKWAGEEWTERCIETAEKAASIADTFIVIGVGGSNNSARALLRACSSKGMRVLYAGNTLSGEALRKVLEATKGHDYVIDCIAKNFATLEPGVSFRLFRDDLVRRYGREGAKERIICTGTIGSSFDRNATAEGYTFIPFPDDIGGRYTALCPVHLLPMAAGGADIKALAKGAEDASKELRFLKGLSNPAFAYALIRNILYKKGYTMEVLSSFEPRFSGFFKWWEQLFAESEGKDGKGLFPKSGEFSEELHSLGQYLQEGTPMLFETFLDLEDSGEALVLPCSDFLDDDFGYVDGKSFADLNRAAFDATLDAHSEKMPCVHITLKDSSEYSMGYLFYFFQFACYVSGKILGVNPFDQPGVEAYKNGMFKALGR